MGFYADLVASQAQSHDQTPSEPPPPPEEPSFFGETGKGLTRGYENFLAGSAQGVGTAADALGYPTQGTGLRAWAQGHREAAAAPELAPESPTWDSTQGFGQKARFIASRGSEAAPGLAAAIAAGAITRRPYLGGVAAFTPSNVGD